MTSISDYPTPNGLVSVAPSTIWSNNTLGTLTGHQSSEAPYPLPTTKSLGLFDVRKIDNGYLVIANHNTVFCETLKEVGERITAICVRLELEGEGGAAKSAQWEAVAAQAFRKKAVV